MKKWQQRFIAIATALGFAPKLTEGSLTADEQRQIFAEYQRQHNVSFQDDRTANEDVTNASATDITLSAEEQQQFSTLMASVQPPAEGNNAATASNATPTPSTVRQANAAMTQTIQQQQQTIQTLAAAPEASGAAVVIPPGQASPARVMAMVMGHSQHTATHLFGIESSFTARSNWWNRITAERKEMDVSALSDEDKRSFKTAFTNYAQSLVLRTQRLYETNAIGMLDYKSMAAGTSPNVDYAELDANFGEYIVRRQDMIIAFFRSLPSVASVFPVQSGIRNKETVPTVLFGELSQGYRKGRIFKGNVKFGSEIYWVNDVMFKYEFDDLIELQKRYVLELSRGSSPFQWTFIEWVMLYFGRQLFNEQQRRRVIGVRVPQQNVVANPSTLASDGALRAIQRVEEERKVLPFFDLGIYSEETMVDYVEEFYAFVDNILPSMDGMQLFANKKHRKWYLRDFRSKYGEQSDFTGTKTSIQDLSPESIVWVDNMPLNCYKMWITTPGNIQNTEYVPNEMLAFKFMEDFESVNAQSRWMEGSVVQVAGVQYKTDDEQLSSVRKNQWLFTNYPVTKLSDGDTTVDGSLNTEFETVGNTAATAIANITNASEERVYKIICGSTSNATTIAKSGKFAKITETWSPKAVGDYIKLYAELEDYDMIVDSETVKASRPTGNFLELERRVTTAP